MATVQSTQAVNSRVMEWFFFPFKVIGMFAGFEATAGGIPTRRGISERAGYLEC
jgi:hypothetical protein